jgi:aminoglycoside phosphotransferase (APT) family kinase protein
MEWVDGVGLAQALQSGDHSAADLGRRCGLLLGRLHQVPPVTDPIVTHRSWIAWAGDFADALAPMLDDHDHRLLHLDFHPENLIITDDAGSLCLLDWANVRLGPPAADLARTLSILELIAIVPGLESRAPKLIMDFRTALLTGYTEAGGEIAVPAPMLAWAYAVQVHDLAGSWVPTSYLDQLRTKINNLLDG